MLWVVYKVLARDLELCLEFCRQILTCSLGWVVRLAFLAGHLYTKFLLDSLSGFSGRIKLRK
jgi:hypothetical protein